MSEPTNILAEISANQSAGQAVPRAARPQARPHTAGRERGDTLPERSATGEAHAEIFYLQKQVQSQTVMVIHLEDGERFEGKIEWYDRDTIKICSKTRQRVLIFKSAIKYIHKVADHHHSSSDPLR